MGLSSLDPADIDTELIKIIANEERLLPHIHESVQSGDNLILKRMLRRHSREQVIEVNEKILQSRQDVIFGADIICGFPTETDEMFQNTKYLLEDAHITLLHAFPFSKRPGTPASQMPLVNKSISKQRVRELKKFSEEILNRKLQEYIGMSFNVLAEDEKNAKTNSFLKVKSTERMTIGEEYTFFCEKVKDGYLIGHPISINSTN
ncbi:MAG: radical SAM protein [Alphaproteobacteria bacterium]|nr:radical SAM protein [Alphaproteobacteria bacterium]